MIYIPNNSTQSSCKFDDDNRSVCNFNTVADYCLNLLLELTNSLSRKRKSHSILPRLDCDEEEMDAMAAKYRKCIVSTGSEEGDEICERLRILYHQNDVMIKGEIH